MAELGVSSLLLGLKYSFLTSRSEAGLETWPTVWILFKEMLDYWKSRMIQYRVTEAQIDGDTSEKKKRKGKKNLLRMAPQLTNYVNRVFTWNKISEYAVDLTRFLQNYVVTNGHTRSICWIFSTSLLVWLCLAASSRVLVQIWREIKPAYWYTMYFKSDFILLMSSIQESLLYGACICFSDMRQDASDAPKVQQHQYLEEIYA